MIFLPCDSVGIDKMVKDIDAGEVLWEEFLDVGSCRILKDCSWPLTMDIIPVLIIAECSD